MATESLPLAKARKNLKALCNQVSSHNEATVITRKNGHHVVLVSLEEYRRLTGEAAPGDDTLENLYAELEREADA